MGIILSCCKPHHKSTQKSEKEYFQEIFDGLDLDGSQTLDANELKTIWEIVKRQRIANLHKQLATYSSDKNKEISDMNSLESDHLLKDSDKYDLKHFMLIIKQLKMSQEELHNFWINTKKNEVDNLNKLLAEYK
jgi:hypothetical protein|tara:strand:+ start:10 stop:411 length:402 start_codon:yes stop_codon:yes gene_type:complete